jgi:hypothetical protein
MNDFVSGLRNARSKLAKRALLLIRNVCGLRNEWGCLTGWNDDPSRTHSEVMAAINLAIAIAR